MDPPEKTSMQDLIFDGSATDSCLSLARGLYQDALVCMRNEKVRRAESKLRLALLYDPAFVDARRELDRITL